jgi:pimeloyl-ACP methyl ester carboxylesterase
LRKHRTRIDGRQVTYREAGNGTPVLVASGLGLSGRFYDLSYDAFASAGMRLVVPDLPGFGSTGGAWLGQRVPETRAFLLSFADAVGIERAVWIGHSIGGQVVIDVATAAPHRVRGLVLAGPTGSPGARKLPRQALALVREAVRAPVPVVLRVLSDYLRISPLAYVGTWVRYGGDTPLEKLRGVNCPVLVVVGTRDPVIDPLFLDVLLRRLPAATLERIPGGTHALPRAHADAFNALVVRFCRELQEPSP